MKKLNRTKLKGRKKFFNMRNLFLLFLFFIVIIAGIYVYKNVEQEHKEVNRYEQLNQEKTRQGILVLKKKYPDMIGWLEVKDTSFSYPVMQTKKNPEYYLHRDEKGAYSFYGTPFLDARCSLQSDMLIIYGHNINGRRFFGFLHNYQEYRFYEKHKALYFAKGDGKEQKYPVISVVKTDIYSNIYQGMDIYNEDEYKAFVQNLIANSLYHCKETDNLEEEMKEKTVEAFFHRYQFLCLSTCLTGEGREKRLLVIGCKKRDTMSGHDVQTKRKGVR